MKLTDAIQRDLEHKRVLITFANRETIKIWNNLRDPKEPPIFTGWYWMHGTREGGPFRCESAAMRDSWYRICLNRAPPLIDTTRDMKRALGIGRRHPAPLLRIVS